MPSQKTSVGMDLFLLDRAFFVLILLLVCEQKFLYNRKGGGE